MHEGGHGILDGHQHEHESSEERTNRWRKFVFPLSLLALIVLGFTPGQKAWLGFDIAIIPMLIGGGFITYSTMLAIIETRRITAGLLVVIALAGSAYVGERATLVALLPSKAEVALSPIIKEQKENR